MFTELTGARSLRARVLPANYYRLIRTEKKNKNKTLLTSKRDQSYLNCCVRSKREHKKSPFRVTLDAVKYTVQLWYGLISNRIVTIDYEITTYADVFIIRTYAIEI